MLKNVAALYTNYSNIRHFLISIHKVYLKDSSKILVLHYLLGY